MNHRLRLLVSTIGVLVAAGVAVFAVARTGGQKSSSAPPSATSRGKPAINSRGQASGQARRSPSDVWVFRGGLPAGWTSDAGLPTLSSTADSLKVVTGGGRYAYQLLSPVVQLAAGKYTLSAVGSVPAGGIGLGLLDAATSRWLSYHGYTAPLQPGSLALSVDLPRSARVRVILTNFADGQSQSSTWALRIVELQTLPLPYRTVFASAVPAGWVLAGGASASPAGGFMRIDTGASPYEYALVSPSGYLSPGSHVVTASVHVRFGGVGVGVLNLTTNKWLAYQHFSSNRAVQPVTLPLTLSAGELVQVVLTNYGDRVLGRSQWDLAAVTVK